MYVSGVIQQVVSLPNLVVKYRNNLQRDLFLCVSEHNRILGYESNSLDVHINFAYMYMVQDARGGSTVS